MRASDLSLSDLSLEVETHPIYTRMRLGAGAPTFSECEALEQEGASMLKPAMIAAAAIIFSIALLGQTAPNNDFAGTWKLNVAKSKFHPGPQPKGETVTIPAGQGKVEVHEVNGEGKETDWSYSVPLAEGTATAIDGLDGATVTEKYSGDRTVDHTWKFPDATETGHGVLSKDGKIMTYTLKGTDSHGKPIHNVLVFEKQ